MSDSLPRKLAAQSWQSRAAEMIARARAARDLPKPAPEVQRLLCSLAAQGKGLREIARELNRLNVRTPRGYVWYAKTVKEQLAAAAERPD